MPPLPVNTMEFYIAIKKSKIKNVGKLIKLVITMLKETSNTQILRISSYGEFRLKSICVGRWGMEIKQKNMFDHLVDSKIKINKNDFLIQIKVSRDYHSLGDCCGHKILEESRT